MGQVLSRQSGEEQTKTKDSNAEGREEMKTATKKAAEQQETNGRYVIIRARDAGCFAGELVSRTITDGVVSVVMNKCRRLWYWAGAASLSQLAVEGTSKPKECKFPPATNNHEILGVIEVIDVTPAGRTSIEGVPLWRA